jgi:hypothetical protein
MGASAPCCRKFTQNYRHRRLFKGEHLGHAQPHVLTPTGQRADGLDITDASCQLWSSDMNRQATRAAVVTTYKVSFSMHEVLCGHAPCRRAVLQWLLIAQILQCFLRGWITASMGDNFTQYL